MRRLFHPALLALLVALPVVACGGGELVPGVREATFVATMAELRRAEGTTLDSAARAVARRRILQQRGLTVDELERAARALAADPPRAIAVWQEIERQAVSADSGSTGIPR